MREQLCLQADAIFFGFKQIPEEKKVNYMQMYEESQYMDCPKAMLALGSIYEKGLADEN